MERVKSLSLKIDSKIKNIMGVKVLYIQKDIPDEKRTQNPSKVNTQKDEKSAVEESGCSEE